jgi:hypothetical protein
VDPSNPRPTDHEPTLDDVARQFPQWEVYKGISGLYYGRLYKSSPPVIVRGENPLDLRDQIRGWLGRHRQDPSG